MNTEKTDNKNSLAYSIGYVVGGIGVLVIGSALIIGGVVALSGIHELLTSLSSSCPVVR